MFETRRRSRAKARLRDGNGAIDAKEGLGAVVPLRASRAALQQAFPSLSSLMRMLPCGPITGRSLGGWGRALRTAGWPGQSTEDVPWSGCTQHRGTARSAPATLPGPPRAGSPRAGVRPIAGCRCRQGGKADRAESE